MTTKKNRRPFLVAAHLVLRRGDQVLMIRRFQTGYEDGNYHLPAGHVEWGETARQAIIREAKEEIDIELTEAQAKPLFVIHRNSTDGDIRVDYFFVADEWEGEPCNQEPEKCDDMQWFDLDKLPPNIVGYAKFALENINSPDWYLEFGWD